MQFKVVVYHERKLIYAFIFSFHVKNFKTVTFPCTTIINNRKMIPSIISNYMPEKKIWESFQSVILSLLHLYGSQLLLMVHPVCSPDKTESYPSLLPYFQRSKSLPVLYCCLSCQHTPELLILIYKISEYVLEQSNQTKIPKHRVRTKPIGANRSISILHGSRMLNLWKRSNLKSKIKFGLAVFKPLFHLVSLNLPFIIL